MPKLSGVNHRDAIRALEKAGFVVLRQGKHVVMENGSRILTTPRHNPGIIANLPKSPSRELLRI